MQEEIKCYSISRIISPERCEANIGYGYYTFCFVPTCPRPVFTYQVGTIMLGARARVPEYWIIKYKSKCFFHFLIFHGTIFVPFWNRKTLNQSLKEDKGVTLPAGGVNKQSLCSSGQHQAKNAFSSRKKCNFLKGKKKTEKCNMEHKREPW